MPRYQKSYSHITRSFNSPIYKNKAFAFVFPLFHRLIDRSNTNGCASSPQLILRSLNLSIPSAILSYFYIFTSFLYKYSVKKLKMHIVQLMLIFSSVNKLFIVITTKGDRTR